MIGVSSELRFSSITLFVFLTFSDNKSDNFDIELVKLRVPVRVLINKIVFIKTIGNLKYKLYEIPIIFTDRIRGQSKLNLSIIYEAVFGLISMKFGQIFSKMFK